MGSIYTGVSGMQAYQQAIDVIANNIANLNTVAYKAGRATFVEQMAQTLSGGDAMGRNPMQIGIGVSIGSVDNWMEQGNLRPTGRPLDMAIAGEGFFIVHDSAGEHYSRDGIVQLDQMNRLIMSTSGMTLGGWQADPTTGELITNVTPSTSLTIPLGNRYAAATQNVYMGGNVDSLATDNIVTSFSAVDSLGTEHSIKLTLTKVDANEWDWTASCPDGTIVVASGSGTITFDGYGRVTSGLGDVQLTLTTPTGANTLEFSIDFANVSQLDGASDIQAVTQDGLKMGTLDNFSIDESGVIYGIFSNGATRILGQVALASFANPAGLLKEGDNTWGVSPSTGLPFIQPAGIGGGKIRSGYLEMSNVDLATEFANMITTQRAFQANSRSITTADEMLQDLLQLKR